MLPGAVVVPQTADEVVKAVRLCREFGVPFVPRGSGTSLSGGSLPVADGLVIALNRLNRILKLDPGERLAVVGAGRLQPAGHAGRAARLSTSRPIRPASRSAPSAETSPSMPHAGAHCLKYGMTSNHVIGIKAVLATGEVVDLGGESVEEPDLT
ncbi:MAG: FAD-dependent oxidoreductase [Verrucomicrobiales bacterium]